MRPTRISWLMLAALAAAAIGHLRPSRLAPSRDGSEAGAEMPASVPGPAPPETADAAKSFAVAGLLPGGAGRGTKRLHANVSAHVGVRGDRSTIPRADERDDRDFEEHPVDAAPPGDAPRGPTKGVPDRRAIRATIEGVVEDALGGTIPGAEIRVETAAGPAHQVRADEAGRFRVDVPAGPGVLTARAAGYGVQLLHVEAPDHVRIALGPASELSGRVVVADSGEPAAGATVLARPVQVYSPSLPHATSDRQGRFHFEDLAGAEYELTASGRGYAGEPTRVFVGAGEQRGDLELRVARAARILADVRLNGVPCPRAAVRVLGDSSYRGEANDRGQIDLPAVMLGRYQAFVTCQGARPLREELDVTADLSPLWDLDPAATLQGVVTVGERPPPGGYAVRVVPADGEPFGGPRSSVECAAESDGRFTCPGLAHGPHECTVLDATGRVLFRGEVLVDARTAEPVVIEIQAVQELRVQIRGGRSLSGIRVFVRDDSQWMEEASRNGDGSYYMPALAPGRYSVMAGNSRDPAPHWSEVILHPGQAWAEVTLPLPAGSQIYGRVIDAAGAPVPDAWVYASSPESPISGLPGDPPPTLTDDRGQFVVDDVAAGAYGLEVVGPSGRTRVDEVETGREVVVQLPSDGE